MERVQFLKLFGAPPEAVVSQMAPKSPLPRKAREVPPKAGFSRVLNRVNADGSKLDIFDETIRIQIFFKGFRPI